MMSLFIDTATSYLIVAVVDEKNNKVLTYYNQKLDNDLSVKVFSVLKECIEEAGITTDDINKIYVSTGPGSFTGVRIGVTIAKTYAWAKKIKVIPLSSLEVIATTKTDCDYNVPCIDARRNCIYAGIYRNDLTSKKTDGYVEISDMKKSFEANKTYAVISNDNIFGFDEILKPKIDVLKVINFHKNDAGINPHKLNPTYLKLTEAEANLIGKAND